MKAAPGRAVLSLARALSKFGVASRKQAEELIRAGRVGVDGDVTLVPERRIDPRRQRVTVDGRRVSDATPRVVYAFHKPTGYVTTRVDPAGRPTIYALLDGIGRWVFPVGRLDRETSGLLVLTNDHQLGQRLTDPEHEVPKTYNARVDGQPDAEALRALREGLPLDGVLTRPAGVRVLGSPRAGGTWLEIVLREGRNRQIRRMCAAVGHEVRELTRVRVGALGLGDLAAGEWRELRADEIVALQNDVA